MTDDTANAAPIDEIPAGAKSPLGISQPIGTYPPRKVPAGTVITYTTVHDEDHPTIELKATELDDDYAYIDPRTAEDVAILDSFDYPVAQRVVTERKDEAERQRAAEKRAEAKAARDAAKANSANGGNS